MSDPIGTTNLLDLRDISLRRADGTLALDRFSLTLAPNEKVVVLGEHGSGKDALIRLLDGSLPPDTSCEGTVAIRGGTPKPVEEGWRKGLAVSYLPAARGLPFAPHVSALKQLCRVAARALRAPVASAREELRLVLSRHDDAPPLAALDAWPAKTDPMALAWGLMAYALCRTPALLLADHAFSDLGPKAAATLLAALGREQERVGFALVYATGSMQAVARLSGRIVVLRQGRVVEEGTREKLESGQAHAYTSTLFRAMPQLSPVERTVRQPIRGQPLLQVSALVLEKAKDENSRPASGLTLELPRGGAMAFVGEEGSGRRAMARGMLGLDPTYSGRVVFDAVALDVLSPTMRSRLRRRIAFITGSDEALDPGMSITQTVEEPLRTHLGISGDLVAGYREAALKRVGLASLDGRIKVAALSPFDRRRLQIARAHLASPLLAVIDEPLRGLDAFAQGVVRELLADMRAQGDAAFLVITADFTVAKALASEAFVFENQRIVERGPMAQILQSPKADITRALIAAVSL